MEKRGNTNAETALQADSANIARGHLADIRALDARIKYIGGQIARYAERRLGAFPLTTSRPWSARNRPVLCFLTPISASGVCG